MVKSARRAEKKCSHIGPVSGVSLSLLFMEGDDKQAQRISSAGAGCQRCSPAGWWGLLCQNVSSRTLVSLQCSWEGEKGDTMSPSHPPSWQYRVKQNQLNISPTPCTDSAQGQVLPGWGWVLVDKALETSKLHYPFKNLSSFWFLQIPEQRHILSASHTQVRNQQQLMCGSDFTIRLPSRTIKRNAM